MARVKNLYELISLFPGITRIYENLPKLTSLREKSLREIYRQIQLEDANTDYCDLAPVWFDIAF
jgi:hypothetical protein